MRRHSLGDRVRILPGGRKFQACPAACPRGRRGTGVFIISSVAWLASLPAGVLVAGGVGFALLLAFVARLAVGALVPAAEREIAYTIAGPLISAFGATFALLMALSLASEASFLTSANGIVSNEAADASRLAWASTSPGVDSAPIHSALLGYLHATRAY